MEELSVEQKAKAYDEALERAKGVIEQNPLMEYLKKGIEYIFPELKESDDEKIRKSLLDYLRTLPNHFSHNGSLVTDWIAWLEKQGEQTPAYKVVPKFKVGDYVVGKYISGYISEVRDDCYLLDYQGFPIDKQDNYHLWTIADAKDGDVLSFNDGHGNDCIELIKSITGKKIEFWFCLTNGNRCDVFDGVIPYTNLASRKDATPATKEQRDTLMKAMTDAGYTFDFENKKLKKIIEEVDGEDYGIDGLWHAQKILEKTLGKVEGYQSDDGILEHKAAITAVKELKEYENLVNYINNERNKINFYYDGKEVPWNEIPLDIRKRDYPYYFKDDLDCYPLKIKL